MTSWNWDDELASVGVGHYAQANTDHSDPTLIQQAYDYVNFSEIAPTPIAAYPCHESAGASTAHDLVGTNDGTISGPTMGVEGLLAATAASGDGDDDVIDFGDVFDETSSPRTLTIWVKTDSGLTTDSVVWNLSSRFAIGYEFQDTGGFNAAAYNGSSWVTATSSNQTQDEWLFLAAVWDGSTLEFFIDAASVASSSLSQVDSTTTPDSLGGRAGVANADNVSADWTHAWIYDDALTQTQLQTLFDVVDTSGDWLGTGKAL